jgi:putative membrane protein
MTKPRKPASFRLEEIEVVDTPLPPPAIATDAAQLPATVRGLPALERGWRWGSILLAAVGGLIGLASVVWLHDLVREMMARQDWIGWTTIGLLGLAILALLMIILREAAGLARLGRLGRLRHEADAAALEGDKSLARDVVNRLKRLYHGRKDLAWGLSRLAEHEGDIMDAAELLRLSATSAAAFSCRSAAPACRSRCGAAEGPPTSLCRAARSGPPDAPGYSAADRPLLTSCVFA